MFYTYGACKIKTVYFRKCIALENYEKCLIKKLILQKPESRLISYESVSNKEWTNVSHVYKIYILHI
jgi:hypothetical protein